MKNLRNFFAVLLMTVSVYTVNAQGTMFAVNTIGDIYSIDLTSGTASLVCGSAAPCFTGMAYDDVNNKLYGQWCNGSFIIEDLSYVPDCAASTTDTASTNGFALNGMEFIGGTLYATAINDPSSPCYFVTVNPATGDVTIIGNTGITGPLSGLAYDDATGKLYAVQGGGQDGFFEIDINTGVATLIGNTGLVLGALEIADGVIYAGGGNAGMGGGGGDPEVMAASGNLYSVDPNTGVTTLVAATGVPGSAISGLAYHTGLVQPIPTMSQWSMLLFGLIVLTLGTVYVYNTRQVTAKA